MMMSDEQGFTLVEVLVAATLLIMGVFATLALIDKGTQTTAVSKQRDVANAVAQEMIERATGSRYTSAINDLTDVRPATPAAPGPADRMRLAMDPDGDQSSSAVAPATATTGTLPLTASQSWSLRRKNTTYTVSYRACTASDPYQGVVILGPFDCTRTGPDPTNPDDVSPPTASGCSLGVIPAAAVDPANPGDLTVKLAVLGITGVSACVGAVSPPLSAALCTLLGSSDYLSDLLVGTNGVLTGLLGGIAGSSVGLCSTTQIEQISAGAQEGMASSTRVTISVSWADISDKTSTITRTALIRRPGASV